MGGHGRDCGEDVVGIGTMGTMTLFEFLTFIKSFIKS